MHDRRNPNSPFGIDLYYTPKEIEEICLSSLRESALLPNSPSPIRIDRFIEKYFQCHISYEDLGKDILGMTVFEPTGKVKLVSVSKELGDDSEINEFRLRSTLAHEAGHCLLHPILFMKEQNQSLLPNPDISTGTSLQGKKIMCRKDEVRSGYNGKWWEYQANRAIGELLLPRKLAEEAVEPFLVPIGSFALPSLPSTNSDSAKREISKIFKVSLSVAEYRLKDLYPDNSKEEASFL